MRNADPPEVITPASLRMFSSGPGGFLWRCADAWEEDIARREALETDLKNVTEHRGELMTLNELMVHVRDGSITNDDGLVLVWANK